MASSSGRQPNFAALNRGRHLYAHGDHHVGHWPTFLVVLGLVFQYYAKRLAMKNVSEMTYFVSSGM